MLHIILHPKTAENTLCSSANGIFSSRHHISGYKISLNKFNKTKITYSIFSDHNVMKLEIRNRKKTGKVTSMWKLNNKQ